VRTLLIAALISITLAITGCESIGQDTVKFGWFYRTVVELSPAGQPQAIDVMIGCESEVPQILGEARSSHSLWAPYFLERISMIAFRSPGLGGRAVA
jgi:hypothetical protein